ncbi:hypothetical protein Bbelb_328540 [Branchiostoma belcheri]|nr:hypothetical protein Bbelb_328540 [Branchiostoma belcheri]
MASPQVFQVRFVNTRPRDTCQRLGDRYADIPVVLSSGRNLRRDTMAQGNNRSSRLPGPYLTFLHSYTNNNPPSTVTQPRFYRYKHPKISPQHPRNPASRTKARHDNTHGPTPDCPQLGTRPYSVVRQTHDNIGDVSRTVNTPPVRHYRLPVRTTRITTQVRHYLAGNDKKGNTACPVSPFLLNPHLTNLTYTPQELLTASSSHQDVTSRLKTLLRKPGGGYPKLCSRRPRPLVFSISVNFPFRRSALEQLKAAPPQKTHKKRKSWIESYPDFCTPGNAQVSLPCQTGGTSKDRCGYRLSISGDSTITSGMTSRSRRNVSPDGRCHGDQTTAWAAVLPTSW